MLDQALGDLDLHPHHDLQLMQPDQSLAALSARVLSTLPALLEQFAPSWVVVQGDTTTVAMAALAAFYRKVPVAHVEAGLRTGKRYDPFPEEINRSLVGRLATLHLAPTEVARANLLGEGISPDRIDVTGNSVIDALYATRDRVAQRPFESLGLPSTLETRDFILVTAHRRENHGPAMSRVFESLRTLADRHRDLDIVYPVHLNPRVADAARAQLGGSDTIRLMPPVGYLPFVKLLTRARLIITDSGGVQEEATALGTPTLVTRETSERPEALASGVAQLVGTDPHRLLAAAEEVLGGRGGATPSTVFGDGQAGRRIIDALLATEASP